VLKMLRRLEKAGPQAQIQLNLYQSSTDQLRNEQLGKARTKPSDIDIKKQNLLDPADLLSQQLQMATVTEEIVKGLSATGDLVKEQA
jgi:hypothetical protein